MAFCGCVMPGCAPRVRTWQPATSPDSLGDTAFLHYLATVPVASVDDATRGLLMVVGSGGADPAERIEEAVRRGWIEADFRLHPDHVLTRGVAAFMLSRACCLPEGLNARVARLTKIGQQRYAIRACADAKLLAYGSPDESLSGGEWLSAVSRADAWIQAMQKRE